jgi:hypothetical protein
MNRQWMYTNRKQPGLLERGNGFSFSGEAFDQRQPIIDAFIAMLDDMAVKTADDTVFRVGQVWIRMRTGPTTLDEPDDPGRAPRPLIGDAPHLVIAPNER